MAVEYILSSPQGDVFTSTQQINLFLAGVGSGKTHLGGYISYNYIEKYPDVFGFIGANTYEQLNTSTLYRIREVWKQHGITEWTKKNRGGSYVVGIQPPPHFNTENHSFDTYGSIISFVNGAAVFKGSLDNAKAHDGKEFGWAILDETKDTKEEDVKDVILARLRQKGIFIKNGELSHEGEPFNPCYFLTSPAKVDWLNKMFDLEASIVDIEASIYSDKTYFHKEFGNKKVTISSTYHNEDNLPSNYIENYKSNNSEERVKALIYANPFAVSGGEFYSSFSRLRHVGEVYYDNSLAVHASFDQNTVPYNSCLLSQLVQTADGVWDVRYFDEICLKNPKNSTEEVCEELLRRYGDCQTIFYYGDASGKNRSTLSRTHRHHYDVIKDILRRKLNSNSNRLLRSNPPLIKRRDNINSILENKLPIRITVSKKCANLLADLTYLKQDVDGSKKKEVVTDPDTKERYQKYGHLSDCMDYHICSCFGNYFQK